MNSCKPAIEQAHSDLQPITFSPVLELTMKELAGEAKRIKRLGQGPLRPSFGAFVVRQGGRELAADFAQRFNRFGPDRLHSLPFGSVDGPLHTDTGFRSGVTALVTTVGEAEGIILIGGAKVKPIGAFSPKATELLFNDSLLETNAIPLPVSSLRTTLHEDDVFIFDHSQPHAIRSTSQQERRSIAYYPQQV